MVDRLIRCIKALFAKKLSKERLEWARINGIILKNTREFQLDREHKCSHRKGGFANLETGEFSNGMDSQFAVIKHQLPMGDWFIKCLRCGKEWKKGDKNYDRALNAPTMNTPSTSIQFTNDKFVAKASRKGFEESDEFDDYEIDLEVA